MKYAIKFYRGCETLSKADEVIIQYIEKDPELINFAQEKIDAGQRLVVDITGYVEDYSDSLDIFKATFTAHPNFAIKLSNNQNVVDLAEMNIPFFFCEGVDSYDILTEYIQMGVSDVYITNELGFDLENVHIVCQKNAVNIRVIPNMVQSRANGINNFTKFFIRPDDISFYDDLVDICEFAGLLNRQPVLYDIYTSEKWLGNLNELILGLKCEIDNKTIMPYFGSCRTSCQKRCNLGKCNICETIKNVSSTLQEKNIEIRKRKNERKVNEEIVQNESVSVALNNGSISKE